MALTNCDRNSFACIVYVIAVMPSSPVASRSAGAAGLADTTLRRARCIRVAVACDPPPDVWAEVD